MELKDKQQQSPREARVGDRVKPVARPKEKIQQQQSGDTAIILGALRESLTLTSLLCLKKYYLCHFADEGEVAEESAIPTDLETWIKNNAEDLKIRLTDRRWAAEVVNDFRENLLKFLNNEPLFKSAECLNAGSYFEKVKVRSQLLNFNSDVTILMFMFFNPVLSIRMSCLCSY